MSDFPSRPRLPWLLSLAVCAATFAAGAQTSRIPELAVEGKLEISLVTAVQIERKLGQLLLVNVDGFGVGGPLAVSQAYLDMVGQLQVGGVIPHYGRCSPTLIRDTNAALAERTQLPLLVAADLVSLCLPDGRRAAFGDGYVGGFIGRYRALEDDELERLSILNGYVLWWLGIDWLLGPTVDISTGEPRVAARARVVTNEMRRFGLLTTLKHWPFLSPGVDLHKESVDAAVPLEEVERRAGIFRELSGVGDALMTTHVYDSRVDGELVTLSPRWLELLRGQTTWSGPVVSDGLFMLRAHRRFAGPDRLPGLGGGADDEIADWAARAILAGHDMVILEGSAATTVAVHRRLLELSCRDDDLGRALRNRIADAHRRILLLKARHAPSRGLPPPPESATVERIIAYLSARAGGGPGDDEEGQALVAAAVSAAGRIVPTQPR